MARWGHVGIPLGCLLRIGSTFGGGLLTVGNLAKSVLASDCEPAANSHHQRSLSLGSRWDVVAITLGLRWDFGPFSHRSGPGEVSSQHSSVSVGCHSEWPCLSCVYRSPTLPRAFAFKSDQISRCDFTVLAATLWHLSRCNAWTDSRKSAAIQVQGWEPDPSCGP